MRNRITKILMILITLISCFAVSVSDVFAENLSSVEITVSVKASGNVVDNNEKFNIVLKSIEEGNPMPEGSVNGVYSFDMAPGKVVLPKMTFTALGDYHYMISQTKGNTPYGKYDETVYYIKVMVRNNSDYTGYELYWNIYTNPEMTSEKPDLVEFINTFEMPAIDLTINKKWEGNSIEHPKSVSVKVLKNGEIYDTLTLGEFNNWTATLKGLDASFKWEAVEVDVPKDYMDTYEIDGSTITITNTYSLIYTGQLKWPVPLMAGTGLLFVILGVVFLKKGKCINA